MAKDLSEKVSHLANTLLSQKRHIKLLEAGCGSASHVHFNAAVTAFGIDVSEEQLKKNSAVQEKILGDIQTYPLPKGEFDVVVCWDVLEHLATPQQALLNLFASTRPGGLIILAFPNLLSFKGLVTKLTPLWFHTLFYRYMHYTFRPFPTFLRASILPKRVMRLAREQRLSVEFFELFEGRVARTFRNRVRIIDWIFEGIDVLMKTISLGRMSSLALDNCVMILQKGNTLHERSRPVDVEPHKIGILGI